MSSAGPAPPPAGTPITPTELGLALLVGLAGLALRGWLIARQAGQPVGSSCGLYPSGVHPVFISRAAAANLRFRRCLQKSAQTASW